MDSQITNRESICEAIVFNDINALTKILEDLKTKVDGKQVPVMDSLSRSYASTLISFAGASAYRKSLSDEVALLIIKHMGVYVDLFSLCSAITYAAGCALKCDESVPAPLRSAVKEDIIDNNVIKTIDGLSNRQFGDFLAYLVGSDDVKSVRNSYCEPILRNIYQRNLVAADFLFANIAGNLSFSFEEQLMNNAVIVPAFIGLS